MLSEDNVASMPLRTGGVGEQVGEIDLRGVGGNTGVSSRLLGLLDNGSPHLLCSGGIVWIETDTPQSDRSIVMLLDEEFSLDMDLVVEVASESSSADTDLCNFDSMSSSPP